MDRFSITSLRDRCIFYAIILTLLTSLATYDMISGLLMVIILTFVLSVIVEMGMEIIAHRFSHYLPLLIGVYLMGFLLRVWLQ